MEIYSFSWIWRIHGLKSSVLLRIIYRLNIHPIRISRTFFMDIEIKIILRFPWNHGWLWLAEAIWNKKNKDEYIMVPDFKICYKSVVIKTGRLWCWLIKLSGYREPYINVYDVSFGKDAKNTQCEQGPLPWWFWANHIFNMQNGLDLSLITRNVEMRLYQRGFKKPHSEGYHQQNEETNRDWEKILARG